MTGRQNSLFGCGVRARNHMSLAPNVLATDETLLGLITASGKEITAQNTEAALPWGQWMITT